MIDSIIKGFEVWTDAQGVKSKGRVKSIDNISLEGITRLRGIILELAIQGKLTSQNPEYEHAETDINALIKKKNSLIEKGLIKKEKTLNEITENEILFEIPNNWSWIKLGVIGITNIGLTYSPNDLSDNGLIVLRSSNIQNGVIDLTDLVRVNKDVDDKVLVQLGDLLICARNGSRQLVGKCALIKSIEEQMAFGAFMAIFRCQFNEYIKLFIESPTYRKNLDGVSTTTINQITQDNLRNTVIPIPPFEEQKRIVAKVNELMKLCDKLEEEQTKNLTTHHHFVKCLLETFTQANDADELQSSWEKISQNFDTLFCTEDSIELLKDAILQLAVMGRLVKQDPTDEPASELLKRIVKEKEKLVKQGVSKKENNLPIVPNEEKHFAIPVNWVWTRLGEVTNYGYCEKVEPGSINDKTWVLELEDIEKESSKLLQKVRVSDKKFQSLKNRFYKGDVIYGKLRPYLDKVIIADEDGICTTEMIPIRGFLDIDSEYLRFVLKSSYFINYANTSTHGMNLPRLGTDKARMALFPLTSLSEQKKIVKKVNEFFTICDLLKERISKSEEIKNTLSNTIIEVV
jgi:type I restriction enzyme S subunit